MGKKLSPLRRNFVQRKASLIWSGWCGGGGPSSKTSLRPSPPNIHTLGNAFPLSAAGTWEDNGISLLRLGYINGKMDLGDIFKIPDWVNQRFHWVNLTQSSELLRGSRPSQKSEFLFCQTGKRKTAMLPTNNGGDWITRTSHCGELPWLADS